MINSIESQNDKVHPLTAKIDELKEQIDNESKLALTLDELNGEINTLESQYRAKEMQRSQISQASSYFSIICGEMSQLSSQTNVLKDKHAQIKRNLPKLIEERNIALDNLKKTLHNYAHTITEEIEKARVEKETQPDYQGILFDQIKKGNLKGVQAALDFGADINLPNSKGDFPLHACVNSGNYELTQFLLSLDVNVNVKNNMGQTALYLAATLNWLDVADLLLSKIYNKQIDWTIADNEGRTAYTVAFSNEVKKLIANCMLWHAVKTSENTQDVKNALKSGADINSQEQPSGETALHKATYYENLNAIRLLILEGADSTIKDKHGQIAEEVTATDYIKLMIKDQLARRENQRAQNSNIGNLGLFTSRRVDHTSNASQQENNSLEMKM